MRPPRLSSMGGLRPEAAVARVPARHSSDGGLAMSSIRWLLDTILWFYLVLVIAAAVMSWLIAFDVLNTRSRVVYQVIDFLNRVTEPALRPIRRILPNLGGIDVSPIILIVLLTFLRMVIADILR